MIDIPYKFEGATKFEDYNVIEDRIREFERYRIIGKDESGQYDLYLIELGTKGKPVLFITASIHGTEWQGTQYSLKLMEDLRDNNFEDQEFRSYLLENYLIAYIPVVNPWGIETTSEYSRTTGRNNSAGVNINRDFGYNTQAETQHTVRELLAYKPFAYLDCHLIRGRNLDEHLIVGNGNPETDYIKERWIDSLSVYANRPVTNWPGGSGLTWGLSRRFMRDQPNDHTPYTLSYITEISRPVDEVEGFNAPLTDEEIHKYGTASIYLFFKTSIDYYKKYNKNTISEVFTPTGKVTITRDVDGIVQSIEEEKKNKSIETTFARDSEGIVQRIIRKN